MTINAEYSLKELANLLEIEFLGDSGLTVTGLATLVTAKKGQLSFYHNARFAKDFTNSQASVIILKPEHSSQCPCACLLSDNPYASYARVSALFAAGPKSGEGIHDSASVHHNAHIGQNVTIGANVVIGSGVVIGDGVAIMSNCFIDDNCVLGNDSILFSNVSIYQGVTLGQRVRVHSGTVIGSDGFGYAREGDKHLKIFQLGSVHIGNDVEIGAGVTIDRGALDDTVIEDGVKIDNQVQIAHNVKIGSNSIICGCSAIAGSSTIGKNCTIAGGVGIINHITIADDVTVTAMSLVNSNIKEAGFYSSGTGLSATSQWKKSIVRFKELDEMSKRISALEKENKQGS